MRKFLPAISVAITALLIPVLIQAIVEKTDNIEIMDPEEAGEMKASTEFELMRQADPATGKIPFNAVLTAYENLKARGFYNDLNSLRSESEDDWHRINDFFPTLSVTKIAYDPNNTQIFYFCTGEGWYNADAITGAGVFKSIDGGETWTQLSATVNSFFEYCQDIVVHPVTGDIYVATRAGGLQRSTDGGATFEKVLGISAGAARNSVCDIELTADGGVFASIGIFETDGIYFSPTGDVNTFVKQTNGFPSTNIFRIEIATAPSNPNVAYAVPCSATDYKIKGIWKTIDKGTTWFEINRPDDNYEFAAKQAWYDLSMAVDPNNENVVAMGGLNLWRTRDGGENWQQITSGRLDSNLLRYVHVDQHEIVFQNSDIVYFGNDGGIWKCDDFTSETPFIYDRNYGYNVTQFYSVSINPFSNNPQVMGGTQDNGTPFAYDDGVAEYKFVSGGDGAYVAFNHEQPEIFYTASQERKMFRLTNGGFEIPDTITNPNTSDANVLFINPFELDASDPDVLYQATNIGIWRLKPASTADTSAWLKAGTIGGVLTAIETTPALPGTVFIGRNSSAGNIYKLINSYTSGIADAPIDIDPNNNLPDIAIFGVTIYCSSIYADENDANHIIVTYSNYGVESIWESTNALSEAPTWIDIEGDLPDIPVYSSIIHPDHPDVCYIATELGVFYTNNLNGDLTQWVPCSSFPVVRTDMLKLRDVDNTIVAGTHGRGIWQSKLDNAGIANDIVWIERGPVNVGGRTRTILIDPNDPTGNTVWAGSIAGGLWKTTDINSVPVDELQVQNQNLDVYPNPVNSILNMDFFIEGTQEVKIELIGLNGNVVQSIANKQLSGKQHFTVLLNKQLPKGIYFVVMKTNAKREVKKIILN